MGKAMKSTALKCHLALMFALAAGSAAAEFDPTAPPTIKTDSAVSQDGGLAWVRMNGRQSLAWYNGATVRLGDGVEGGHVAAIREDHIVIAGKGGNRSVYLLDRTIRSNRRH